MDWTIPSKTPFSFRKGEKGLGVWALQSALVAAGKSLTVDGDFGPNTEHNVREFQTENFLLIDGIAGPGTQKAVVKKIVDSTDARYNLPHRLLEGFAQYEGGYMVAAVNWSVAGGVDCGAFQRRVTLDGRTNIIVGNAFNTKKQAELLATTLVDRRATYRNGVGTKNVPAGMSVDEKAWRLAALYHNYPLAAARLSVTPIKDLPSYWTTDQSWVVKNNIKFADGNAVSTPLEWCHFYAGVLGNVHSTTGLVTRLVSNW